MQRLDELVIAPAFSGDLPPHIEQQVVIGKDLDAAMRARASSKRSAAAASTSSRRRR